MIRLTEKVLKFPDSNRNFKGGIQNKSTSLEYSLLAIIVIYADEKVCQDYFTGAVFVVL